MPIAAAETTAAAVSAQEESILQAEAPVVVSQPASVTPTVSPTEPTTAGPAIPLQPVRAQKLTPEELRKKFPFTKNLSAVQPARVVEDNKYFHDRWFMTQDMAKSPPTQITGGIRELPQVYVARANQLPELCKYLARTPIVAVDTEFHSHNVYRPSLQVIQIGTPDLLAAVDVQLLGAAPEFKEMLEQLLEKEWVLHSHRGDLEVIYDIATKLQLKRVTPARVFDTQIAIAFLSPAPSIAYADMLQDMLGIEIDKTSSLSDWSRRPLTLKQIEYALQDVKYLLPIMMRLKRLLQASTPEHNAFLPSLSVPSSSQSSNASSEYSRLEWFLEEMSLLSSPSLYAPLDPSAASTALPSRRRLEAGTVGRKVFDRLSEWRERTAAAKDTLPAYVMAADQLVALAQTPPRKMEDLNEIPGMRRSVAVDHGEAILKVVGDAHAEHVALLDEGGNLSVIPEDAGIIPSHQGSNRVQFNLQSLISAFVEQRAMEVGISTYILAPRRDRSDLSALSLKAIQEAAQWNWKGVRASHGTHEGFWPSLQPASVNYRFAVGITEETVFQRLLLGGQTERWIKEAGVGETVVVHGAAEVSDAVATPTVLHASRPIVPLPYPTEVTLLRFSKLLRGWRREVVGSDVLALLEGRKALRWEWTKDSVGKLVAQDVDGAATSSQALLTPQIVGTKTLDVDTTIHPEPSTMRGSPASTVAAPTLPASSTTELNTATIPSTPSIADSSAAAPKKKRSSSSRTADAAEKAAAKAAKLAEKERLAAEKGEQKRMAAEAKEQAKLEKAKAKEAKGAAKKSRKK